MALPSEGLDIRLVAGFALILFSSALLNKAGDFFYHKGVARPFYVLGHRLHHKSVLQALVPVSYVAVASMVYFHYLRVLWYSFWPSLEITVLVAGACVASDMILDYVTNSEKRTALLHHEWLYLIVPVYALTHLVAFV